MEDTNSPNPYEPPESAAASPAPASGPTSYDQVPFYRRNGFCSGIIVAHILMICCFGRIPIVGLLGIFTLLGTIAVCVIVLTGPVYYNQVGPNGVLKQWGKANKVAAVILLVLFIGAYGAIAYFVVTQMRGG